MTRAGDTTRTEDASDSISWALHDLIVAASALDVRLAQRLGLSPGDFHALKHLMTSDRALGTVELGALVGLTSGSATGLVDRLEAAGQVRRTPDPRDRRRLILTVTDEARSRVLTELGPLDAALQRLVGRRSAPEQHAILDFLTEVTPVYRGLSPTSRREAGRQAQPPERRNGQQ